jgi:predicted small lipoprotein YifL
MKRISLFFIPLFLVIFFDFCGKKGPLLPPVKKIPQKIEVFELRQRGDKVVLEWENPVAYIDGHPLSGIVQVEILIAREGEEFSGWKDFEKRAALIKTINTEEFSKLQIQKEDGSVRFIYSHELSMEDLTQKKLTFGIRVREKKKNRYGFSDLSSLEPKTLSLPPQGVNLTVFRDRIEIRWDPPEKNIDQSSPSRFKGYNIYREEEDGLLQRLNSQPVKERKYDDKDFSIGSVYRYYIRTTAADSPPFLESGDSEVIEILIEDTFAPAPPLGLVSVAAENFISISWDANQDEDLAGYRVWRKVEGEAEYVLLTPETILENAYNDSTVEKNKRYYYAITALDESGNESPKSKSVSEIIKD